MIPILLYQRAEVVNERESKVVSFNGLQLSFVIRRSLRSQVAYREARRAAFGQSIARLQQAASAAASTLLKIMVDVNSPTSCRLRAADSVLSHAAKAIEIEDIEARVAQLERAAEVSKR